MICKKCGSDAVEKEDGRFVCKNCGAVAVKAEQPVEASGDKAEKGKKKKKSPLREALDFMLPIVLAMVIAVVLKTCVFANAQVPTGSMLNTIQLKDRVIASRLDYKFHEPQRGDIVIFKAPDDVAAHEQDSSVKVEFYVKRLIGLPGETVNIVNGVVYITKTDGSVLQLEEPYITACVPEGDYGPFEVPENHYFMMGDNRNSSHDSRFWENKYVDRSLLVGNVKFRYYPNFTVFEQPVYGEGETE